MNEEVEETVLDASGNDPAPVVDSAPVDTSAPSVTEEQETSSQPVEVISVDELLDRLTNTGNAGEDDSETGEVSDGLSAPEEGIAAEEGTETGGTGSAVEYEEYTGPSNSDKALELLEVIQKDVSPHPFLTTDFADYTVTEGLLLMALLLAVIFLCVKMLKEGFSWL